MKTSVRRLLLSLFSFFFSFFGTAHLMFLDVGKQQVCIIHVYAHDRSLKSPTKKVLSFQAPRIHGDT